MVVICAGTTGYNATVDLRYLWMRQKRLQGSHFANDAQASALNELVLEGKVDPCLSSTFAFKQLPEAHQLMFENLHPHGNMAILVGATEMGTGVTAAPLRTSPKAPPRREAQTVHVRPRLDPRDLSAFDDATLVSDVMHEGVITCAPDSSVPEIATLLVDHQIHAVVVVNPAGDAVGVVSQTDLVLTRQGRSPGVFSTMKAEEIMTAGLVTCTASTPLSRAITDMTRLRIHRLVVVDDQAGKRVPVGVVSMTDVIRKMMGA
jgi:crotonyl-CoA carboxylase/reductase